jgi:hypothetical protein
LVKVKNVFDWIKDFREKAGIHDLEKEIHFV